MGFGDPDHQHPLTFQYIKGTCFRCELRISPWYSSYGCTDCNHFVHQVCLELPHNMKHPLHPQHPLTLFSSPSSQTDCSLCHHPCLGGYTYQCQTCPTFSLHLKCFISVNIEEKHEHPLTLYEIDDRDDYACRICGFPIYDTDSYTFTCRDCRFLIHFECAYLPSKVKRHHVHELTFEYNYPKESDLSYCDVCEDKVDEEPIDRTLSYYYCKRCDYIAHVNCVTTKPDRVTTQLDNFVHEHPMIYCRKIRLGYAECACKEYIYNEPFYFCSQCDYKIHKSCAEFPRLIKHPHHKDHTLSLRSCASLNTEAGLSNCGFCFEKIDSDELILLCIDCDYAEHLRCAMWFSHPHYQGSLLLTAGDDRKFRCNACGELGHGCRMSYNWMSNNDTAKQYDLHLECFALPGKIDCGLHSHPLFLVTSPKKIGSNLSTTFLCEICRTEANPNLWIYCCTQCNYIAHLKCTVGDLLPAIGSSNDSSSIFYITRCEKEQFMVDHSKPGERICSKLSSNPNMSYRKYPIFRPTGFFEGPKFPLRDRSDQQMLSSLTDWEEPSIDALHCPKCERPISSQAFSSVTDWVHCNFKANIFSVDNHNPPQQEPLTLLDEKLVDQLYCPICNQLIFAPTYSCSECQIFFHRSCAELPRKYTIDPAHIFVLLSPSMCNITLLDCVICRKHIQGYAYVCRSCEIAVHVVCALGSPLLKIENLKHSFFSESAFNEWEKCKACDNPFDNGSVFFKCAARSCEISLHFECALLPYTKLHRIHHHPLVLEPRLNLSVDDYICDACEKELNPYLWAYRCSDSCGDRATSHVSCIVTSNKKCHFDYNKECRYPDTDQLDSHVNRVKKKGAAADLVTELANLPLEEQRNILGNTLLLLVDEIEHEYAFAVSGMLLEMDRSDVLHWIESPDALKAKVGVVMEAFRIAYVEQANMAAEKLAIDDGNGNDNDGDDED